MSNLKDAIIQRVLELCEKRGIRLNELANRSGVTPSTVYSLCSPHYRDLSVSTLKRLCDGLEISVTDFFNHPLFSELEQEQ